MSVNSNQEVMETQMHREDDIVILTINNPLRRNAMSDPVKDDMRRHLKSLMADRTCRAIIVTGAGGAFCSGGDVKNMKKTTAETKRDYLWRRFDRHNSSSDIMLMLLSGPKPVVTAVEGTAFGSGLGLAIASDYTVAANNARFAAAQIRRGLCPDGLMYYSMTFRCGGGRARELMLTGREFNGIEAEKYGIAHEVTEPGNALAAAMKAAARFAALPPLAFALTKSAMTNSYHTVEATYRAEQDYQPMVGLSKDHKESVAAYLEKRKPVYTGE